MESVAFRAGAEGPEGLVVEVDSTRALRGPVGGCAVPFLCTATGVVGPFLCTVAGPFLYMATGVAGPLLCTAAGVALVSKTGPLVMDSRGTAFIPRS